MSSTYAAPLDAVEHALDDLATIAPEYRTTGEKKDALVRLSRIVARVEAERMRILKVSDDIALETGARSTAHWLADATRDGIGQVRLRERLATAAGERTCAAMGEGAVNVAQAREIVEALDRLPKDLDPELRDKGEAYLVGEAAHVGPRELERLGQRLLEVIAPDTAEQAEYQRLLAEDRPGSGGHHGHLPRPWRRNLRPLRPHPHARGATLPDLPRGLHLTAPQPPRRPAGRRGRPAAPPRRRGEAFCALLENLPTNRLPKHGGTATTVMVMTTLDQLRDGVGVADTSTGDRLTAEQTRRLACQAGMPALLLCWTHGSDDRDHHHGFHRGPARVRPASAPHGADDRTQRRIGPGVSGHRRRG